MYEFAQKSMLVFAILAYFLIPKLYNSNQPISTLKTWLLGLTILQFFSIYMMVQNKKIQDSDAKAGELITAENQILESKLMSDSKIWNNLANENNVINDHPLNSM